MTKDEIIVKLRDMMKQSSQEDVDWDQVDENSEIEPLGFDSLAILDLVYDIQQEFNLEFDAEELVDINTVGKLADFLRAKGA
ncbi:MAG: acyl carrier protein [Verrucomicrobiota bacterium]